MGKSMLIDEFAADRQSAGWLVARVEVDDAANSPTVWMLHLVRGLVRAALPQAPVEPEFSSIRVAIRTLPTALVEAIESLFTAATQRGPSAYQMFAGSLRLGQRFAEELDQPLLLCLDELPAVLNFSRYSDLSNLRGTLRAIVEKESPRVMFLIAGSAVRAMRELLEGDSPLLTRVAEVSLGRFAEPVIRELIERLLNPVNLRIAADAADAICDYAAGHPYYADCLIRRAVQLVDADGASVVERRHVDQALFDEVMTPSGFIANACHWLYTKSITGPAAVGDRALLQELSRFQAPVQQSELLKVLTGWDRMKISRRLRALVKSEIVSTNGDSTGQSVYGFADPLFAVWLSGETGVVGATLTETLAAQRRYTEKRMQTATHWFEASLGGVMFLFDGSRFAGASLGVSGYVVLPKFTVVENLELDDAAGVVFGHPSTVEIDAYGRGSECWLAEAKAGRNKSTQKDLQLVIDKAAFLRTQGYQVDRLWLVAEAGHTEGAETMAKAEGILLSTGTELKRLRMDLVLRQRRKSKP